MESFSQEERDKLNLFFSNTEKNIFVLKNLPEVVKGTLFSRYSRSPKSLRRLFLDEFATELPVSLINSARDIPLNEDAVKKAEDFYARVLDGYGDDSVGELGGTHIALEGVSQIAAKIIEDCRLGGSPLEKSTRYIFFDQKDENGNFKYYRDSKILASEFSKEYIETMDFLFETYTKLIPKLTAFITTKFSLEDFEFPLDPKTNQLVKYRNITDESIKKKAEIAYRTSTRGKVCDALRYLLPTGTLTNIGLFGNGRFFDYLLKKLYSHPLTEMNELAVQLHQELDKTVKPFVRRAKKNDYLEERFAREKLVESTKNYLIKLSDFDALGEDKIVAGILYEFGQGDLQENIERASKMSEKEKNDLITSYVGVRPSRRDRPGRAFELAYLTFDLNLDFGAYRDLQRHRILTQYRHLLSCSQGYETPREIIEAGLVTEYNAAMLKAKDFYDKLKIEMPVQAQYIIPLGYKMSYYMKLNVREAFHLIELRTSRQGHPSYRKICIEMFHQMKEVYPLITKHMIYVDENDYEFVRLASELKKELKK